MSGIEDGQGESQKRPIDNDTLDDAQHKKVKTESSGLGTESQLDDIFNDPIPGFGDTFKTSGDKSSEMDFDNLPPSFLEDSILSGTSTQEIPKNHNTHTEDNSKPNASTSGSVGDSRSPTVPSVKTEPGLTSTEAAQKITTSTSTNNDRNGPISSNITSTSNIHPGLTAASRIGSAPNISGSVNTPPSGLLSLNRPMQVPGSTQPFQPTTLSYTDPRLNREAQDRDSGRQDSSQLNDAIAAAGVNLQQEEEILLQQQLNRRSDVSNDLRQVLRNAKAPAFLNPYHVASFMSRVARDNGVQQNFLQDGELLDLMSASCESWISNILTKTVILSRHRRRGIPTLTQKNKKQASTASSASRSELSRELRNLAAKQKELEEKRVSKRILLGLEKNASDAAEAASGGDAKAGAEETLHRAANATAAMMTMNPGRKKYSWMTSNAGASEAGKGPAEVDGKNKQSTIISSRGDNGLRFREIRSGNSITMKDLLGAIEDERMGTEKAIIKGFAKLKD